MHPNAQVVLRGFQAFADGDIDAMRGLFAEDAVWHGGGSNKWSGDYTGLDSIVSMMGDLGSEATIENRPHAVLADDDHVVVLNQSSLTRNGKTFNGNTVFVFHVSDGKTTDAWTVPADPYGLDEFWAD